MLSTHDGRSVAAGGHPRREAPWQAHDANLAIVEAIGRLPRGRVARAQMRDLERTSNAHTAGEKALCEELILLWLRRRAG